MKPLHSLAALAATAAFVLVPTMAGAATLSTADASGDVVSRPATPGTASNTPAPERAEGDILNSRISHRAYAVTVKVRYRDLTRTGGHAHLFVIRTAKLYRRVTIITYPTNYHGKVEMVNARDKKVPCTISPTLDYVANTAFVKIPRSCLGNPRWVRVGIVGITLSSDFKTAYADDARTHGVIRKAGAVYSPRVYKG